MGIKNFVAEKQKKVKEKLISTAKDASDVIANMSQLSSKQLKEVEQKRQQYLGKVQEILPNHERAGRLIGAAAVEAFNAYLPLLSSIYAPIQEIDEDFDEISRIRFFDITKWVNDKNEDSIEKLMNVYQVLNDEECAIALIYHRAVEKTKVSMAIVNKSVDGDPTKVISYRERLSGAIKGNFPGAELTVSATAERGVGIPPCLKHCNESSVAIVSNLAAEKSDNFVSQTMEKLLDGIVPEKEKSEYTIVLLAEPVIDKKERNLRLEELYSRMYPYAEWQINRTMNENNSYSSQASAGASLGAGANASRRVNSEKEDSQGVNIGIGLNFGMNFTRSSIDSETVGINRGVTQNAVDYRIKHTLDLLEKQIDRQEQSSALGMWDFAAYVISEDPVMAKNVAHTYLALTRGENSNFSEAVVNFWRGDLGYDNVESCYARSIINTLARLYHPSFVLRQDIFSKDNDWLMYPAGVNATVGISGKELAYSLNFPQKSLTGFPVFESVAFGRNISSYAELKKTLKLGYVYHMHHMEQYNPVELDKDSLTSHVFVTGSTGAGKSNTVFNIVNRACQDGKTSFLIIEPAKGEYKNVFGGRADVNVYGTNPQFSELLRINPFSFPSNIAVSEHVDRLIEIFNVCWPMYAAMPAILKDAVIRVYIKAGWDMETSENKYGCEVFPDFDDVLKEIRIVLKTSDYSDESKGDYIGSLVSRVKSLTNGINGQILTSEGLSDHDLFDKNVIIDLSRVGSVETKALLMGLLVMKLQEYRLSEKKPDNSRLEHLTVLEEAHNLLKRTSTEQSSDSSNLLGKSVEMLSNAIAELRAFGEGFVIADQAPGLLDLSVIRNTNTKIIHRLPEVTDRELTGGASGMNEDQINELAKLEMGVAAVYQNNWIEPVLCKVDLFNDKAPFTWKKQGKSISDTDKLKKQILNYLFNTYKEKNNQKIEWNYLEPKVIRAKLPVELKADLLQFAQNSQRHTYSRCMYSLFDASEMIEKNKKEKDVYVWSQKMFNLMYPMTKNCPDIFREHILGCILNEQVRRDATYSNILAEYSEIYGKGGLH